jgi:hypothetical protein
MMALINAAAITIAEGAHGIRPFAVKPEWANAIRPYGMNHHWPKR